MSKKQKLISNQILDLLIKRAEALIEEIESKKTASHEERQLVLGKAMEMKDIIKLLFESDFVGKEINLLFNAFIEGDSEGVRSEAESNQINLEEFSQFFLSKFIEVDVEKLKLVIKNHENEC